eukprot:3937851-Rhodomonas_salina.8
MGAVRADLAALYAGEKLVDGPHEKGLWEKERGQTGTDGTGKRGGTWVFERKSEREGRGEEGEAV